MAVYVGKTNSCAARRADRGVRAGHVVCGQVRSGLSPGGSRIRTIGPSREQGLTSARLDEGVLSLIRKKFFHATERSAPRSGERLARGSG
jgi:hypothetical protein